MSQIEEIKQKLDISEVIQKYVPELKRSGRNYKARCPFHSEKSASFMVNPDIGIYKCFGCGEGGDVINFIQQIERVNFPEALETAAEIAGVKLEKSRYKKDPDKEAKIKRLKQANKLSAQYYNYLLTKHPAGEGALKYASKRGLIPSIIEKFSLGYAPAGDNLHKFLTGKGFKSEELVNFSLVNKKNNRYYDKFRNRLVFPIHNLKGEVIGFSGRTLEKNGVPKYLNSSETEVYRKSDLPYAIYQAKDSMRKQNFVIVFEGNIDILSSHRLGIENAVCPLGTALTIEQLKAIKRYVDEVYFCFDTDDAGYKALLRGIELAEIVGVKYKSIDIDKYQDADELMMSEPDRWRQCVDQAQHVLEHIFARLIAQNELDSPDGKVTIRDEAIVALKLVRDEVVVNHYIDKLGKLVGESEESLRRRLERTGAPNQKAKISKQSPKAGWNDQESAASIDPSEKIVPVSRHEQTLLGYLVQLPNLDNVYIEDSIFGSGEAREVYSALKSSPKVKLNVLAGQLSAPARELLETVIVMDLPNGDILGATKKLHNKMYSRYLRKNILGLQQQLEKLPDDKNIINKLHTLTTELRQMNKNINSWPALLKDEK